MTAQITADALITQHALRPHPEGGHYREVFRSTLPITTADARGSRSALTVIHFLLRAGEQSRWHRVRSDEVWHHAGGGSMELLLLTPELDRVERVQLGGLASGDTPLHVVPAHWWQAARPLAEYAFCSCMVGPGFDFSDFTFMELPTDQERVRTRFPELASLL